MKAADVEVVDLQEKFGQFSDHWCPRIVADLNGQQVKLARLEGEFVWHSHAEEDEMFLVIEGQLRLELRDRTLELGPGQMAVVPRGVEHRPVAEEEVQVMLFEPASTVNTGNVGGDRTVDPRRL